MLSFSLFSKIVQSGEFHFLTIGGLISFSSPDIKKDCEIELATLLEGAGLFLKIFECENQTFILFGWKVCESWTNELIYKCINTLITIL